MLSASNVQDYVQLMLTWTLLLLLDISFLLTLLLSDLGKCGDRMFFERKKNCDVHVTMEIHPGSKENYRDIVG